MANKEVTVIKNGPYKVNGNIPLDEEKYVQDENGVSLDYEKVKDFSVNEEYYLCRCGKSKNKPFCDGTHSIINFDGTETANNEKYLDKVKKYDGPEVSILDCEEYCVGARFCDAYRRAWEMVINPNSSEETKLATDEAIKCPGGRLTILTKDGTLIEPVLIKEISALDDPALGVRGPLQLKGGIQLVSSEGKKYELRNRATVCRCGFSGNKPFCDGSHLQDKYENNGL